MYACMYVRMFYVEHVCMLDYRQGGPIPYEKPFSIKRSMHFFRSVRGGGYFQRHEHTYIHAYIHTCLASRHLTTFRCKLVFRRTVHT